MASHNPRILKSRVVGAHLVNGTPPPYAWAIGGTRRSQDWPQRRRRPSGHPDRPVTHRHREGGGRPVTGLASHPLDNVWRAEGGAALHPVAHCP